MINLQAELDSVNKKLRHAKIESEGLALQLRLLESRIELVKLNIERNEATAKRLNSADVPKEIK